MVNINPDYISFLLRSKLERYIGTDVGMRIIKGAFWGTIGTITSRSITVFLSFLLARILGKEGFGEYGIIITTTAMVSGFAGLGIGATVTRYVASLKVRKPEQAGKIIGLSTIITWLSAVIYGFAFIYFAPWLAETTLSAPHLGPILQISSIIIAFGVVNSVQISSLAGLESFKISALLGAILNILQSVLVVILAYWFSIRGAITGLAISSSLNVLLYYFVSSNELKKASIKVTFRDAWSEWRILVKFSLPAFLSTISVGPVIWASNAFLAKQPYGYGQLGIYNAAIQWDTFVQLFPALISTAVLPIMADMYGRGDKKGSLRIMWKMMKYSAFLVVPIAILVSVLSPIIIKAYGSSFKGEHLVIIIVVSTTVLSTVSANLGTFISAAGKMWIGFGINCAWGISFLFLSYFLVRWGAKGLAAAKFLAYFVHLIWALIICFILSRRINSEKIISI